MKKEFVFRFVLGLGVFFLIYQLAVKPLLLNEKQKSGDAGGTVKISSSSKAGYDVVVYGEEPDGIAAAVSAARLGAKTLLLSTGKDLGGPFSRCLLTDLEVPYGKGYSVLNAGFLSELEAKTGRQFSPTDYIYAVNSLVKAEGNIEVRNGVSLDSVSIKNNKLVALNIALGGVKSTVEGDIFIDSSRNGELLDACGVPYMTGSEDLNLKDSYMPVRLNFEMKGTNITKVKALTAKTDGEFYETLGEYEPADVNSGINDFNIYVLNEKTILVQGVEIANVDALNPQKLKEAYSTAIAEARNLSVFLSNKFEQLKNWTYLGAADSLYIREGKHYKGLYSLSVNEVLSNTYFDNIIAMGSYPVQIGKFAGKGTRIAGKPVQYAIPLGCIIPKEVDNLLMTGAKISYSSLAASSAGTIGTSIATGNSAGVLAAFCLLNRVEPADVNGGLDTSLKEDFQKMLSKEGLVFPHEEFDNKLKSNWTYVELEQLLSLGLIAGGEKNDYSLDKKAVQRDLAILLLNGIYRLNPSKYTLELDTKLRPYFSDKELTRDGAALMLEELYNLPDKGKEPYKKVCELGYINSVLELSLKNKQVLTMDDVFYLSAQTISKYTGRSIGE